MDSSDIELPRTKVPLRRRYRTQLRRERHSRPAAVSRRITATSGRARAAFSLVELLVVVAIIALLLLLLLPALNAAREAARRIQCVSNIRQLGLGVINYESLHMRLPPSGLVDKNEDANMAFGSFDPRSGKMISWVVLILPQIEEQNLYSRFDLRKSIFDQSGEPQAEHISTLLCPSDGAENRYFDHPDFTQDRRFAKGNYAAYVSPFHIDLQMEFPGALGGGGQRLTKITDGTSKTIMLSEVRTRANPRDQRGAWALPWCGASLLSYDVHHFPPSQARYEPWLLTLPAAQVPNNQGFNVDMLYDCPQEEEAQLLGMPCAVWNSTQENFYLSAAPRSQHPGGVNIVAMDGHVAFLPDDVDRITMAYMVSIHDGYDVNLVDF